MIIGIDAKPLTIPFECGIKTYLRNLLWAVAELDKSNKYIVYLPKNVEIPRQPNFIKKVDEHILPWQIRFAHMALRDNLDIIHLPQQHGSVFLHHPHIITTVHDMALGACYPTIIENPYYFFLGWYTRFIRNIIFQKSSRFIAVSDFTKQELQSMLPTADVHRIYEGAGPSYRVCSPRKKRKYFLAMTDFSPRKNSNRTIMAFSQLPKSVQMEHPLLIVVSMRSPIPKLHRMISDYHLERSVKIHYAPTMQKLIALLNESVVFIYPSVYEGFGLPILEAMACGCPVITSNFGAMKEIAGNAAYFVNPYSVSAITEAMKIFISDEAKISSYRKSGIMRAKEFTWKKTAQETIALYEKTCAS